MTGSIARLTAPLRASVTASVLFLGAVPLARPPAILAQDDKSSEAIDRGIDFLLPATETFVAGLENNSGVLSPKQGNHDMGKLALQVYGLVVAGVSVENPTIKRSFQLLERMTFSHTYTTALYIFALDAAISQLEDDMLLLAPQKVQAKVRDDGAIGREYRPRLQAAVESFLRTQNRQGVWRYHPGEDSFDNSNVQFAVLAIGVGAKRHVNMDPSVWQRIADHFIRGQQKQGEPTKDRITLRPKEERGKKRDEVRLIAADKDRGGKEGGKGEKEGGKEGGKGSRDKDAVTVVKKKEVTVAPNPENPEIGTESIEVLQRGWDYENKGSSSWNMTCAGLSSLLLARENLRGKISGEAKTALDKAIRDGYGWVMGHWSPGGSYYGMYSLEKVGDLGDVQKFGPHDWHKELTDQLVGSQQADGSWAKGGGHEEDPNLSTAFALLILNRATSLLTMSPVSRIVVSGKTSAAENPEDRSWVYVPDLDTTLHYPSLLRTIRQRPSPKLLRFLENIVDNYADERKGDLVPELAYVRDSIQQKTAQKIIDDYLVKITGYRYKDPEDYLKWHRRWERIRKIGETKSKDHAGTLLNYYKSTTKSVTLKKTLMWALTQVGTREAIPLFLEDMSHPEAAVRLSAYNYFRAFFLDFPPPFDPQAAEGIRENQVAALKDWYAKQE
ncbi:MAG: hypothetical protein HY721_27240 [Planctomycetes bacterium]|nr:hypothetical protein [Planctomycetota bacterium]